MTKRLFTGILLSGVLLTSMGFAAEHRKSNPATSRVEREVRRELVMLPYYTLFDHLAFQVDGESVTLLGKVSRPILKSDAGNVVRGIKGVEKVTNRIVVLPVSGNDARLRLALYSAIYGHSALQTLAVRANPPIHIIVENGNVTLEGMAGNDMQKQIARMQAGTVPGVFSVTDNLRVEGDS